MSDRRPGADARTLLYAAGMTFLGNLLFPRLAYRLRWPTRLRGWALLAYIAWNTALLFWFRQWAVPALGRYLAEADTARQALRDELGREPTDEEVLRRLA
jgi:hypothetical protein